MRKNKKIILIVLLVIAVAVIWIRASAEEPVGSVSVVPSTSSVKSGDTFTVTVGLSTTSDSIETLEANVNYSGPIRCTDAIISGADNININDGYVTMGMYTAGYATQNVTAQLTFVAEGNAGEEANIYIDSFNVQVGGQSRSLSDFSGSTSTTVTIEEDIVEPTAPELSPATLNLEVGQSGQVSVTNGVEIDSTSWASNNESVATVDSNGNVYAVGAGEASIMVRTTDGTESNSVAVIVTEPQPVEPDAPAISPTSLSLYEGESGTLSITNGVEVNWNSSDTNIAVVDENGTVAAVSEGTATITATSKADESKFSTATVTVNKQGGDEPVNPPTPEDPGTAPVINNNALSLNVNETGQFTITNGVSVTWSSSNAGVAMIDSQSGVVVALSEGTATITATSTEHPDKKATASVYVTKPVEIGAPVVSPSGLIKLKIGEEKQMSSDTNGASWSSSNTGVVQVDQTGKLTAIAAGDAKITVTNPSNNKSSEFYVVVSNGNEENNGGSANNNGGNTNNGGTSTKTNTVAPQGSANSTSENDVPATGESTVEMIVALGIVTLIVATIIFRKKSK